MPYGDWINEQVLDLSAFVLVFAAAVYSAVRRPALEVTRS